MMFNGLLMCDSDCSDYFKDSSGPSSVAENMSGAERVRCLQDKLHATLQILKNKEETVRVQAESLALAEERLSAFATRTHTATIHRGLQVQPIQNESGNGCEVETTDVSVTAQTQAMDEKMVKTLKDNVSIVEDLYRECFYESARQGHLIESLRGSYLQLRLMDKEKDDQLFRLQRVVDTQRSAAFAYQDIASDVDNLKAEISNFLNNSNNDSGMWERGEDSDVTADLRHIAEQLRRLRDLLTEECTCGLDEEHKTLKRTNEFNERLIGEFRERINVLEETLEGKENADQRYLTLIAKKEREINDLRKQLTGARNNSQRQCCCEQMSSQLQQTQGSLNDKTLELVHAQQKCEEQSETIRELRQELEAAKVISEENASVRQEVSKLRCEVTSWRSQQEASALRLHRLQNDLIRSQNRCTHLSEHYREISNFAFELQAQLKEAQSRGAKLCGEAKHAVCAVRHCLRRQRDRQREQEERIKKQEILIQSLQDSHTESARAAPCCSKYISSGSESSKAGRVSGSEITTSPPTPPRRLLLKKSSTRVECHRVHPTTRTASVQRPTRSSCATNTDSQRHVRVCSSQNTREISPTDELLERVERAHEALAQAQRRWCRRAPN